MHVQPYLNFDGRCEEAVEFYKSALGAEVTYLTRFKDAPPSASGPSQPPGSENKIMHVSFRIGDSMILASDGRCGGRTGFQGFSLSLTTSEIVEAERMFAALADGGTAEMPLAETFFSPRFGMLSDRFGVRWMIFVEPK